MQHPKRITRLDYLMSRLDLSSTAMAGALDINHSLITKWRRGERPLSLRSSRLSDVARFLIAADRDGIITRLFAPYVDSDKASALVSPLMEWLCNEQEVSMPGVDIRPQHPHLSEYALSYRAFLGKRGLRDAFLTLLDIVASLPTSQQIMISCLDRYDFLTNDPDFLRLLIPRLQEVFKNGTTLSVICRNNPLPTAMGIFPGLWFTAHLRGFVRSLYHDEAPPLATSEKLLAAVRGHCSLYMYDDFESADGAYLTLHADPVYVRHVCGIYENQRLLAKPLFLYNFLSSPMSLLTDLEQERVDSAALFMIQQTPGFCFTEPEELFEISRRQRDPTPSAFNTLLCPQHIENTSIKLVLCHEEIVAALKKGRQQHSGLSCILGRRGFLSQNTMQAQLRRIVKLLKSNDSFEVALLPRVAFEKIGLELHALDGVLTIAWLSDASQSAATTDAAMSSTLYRFGEFVWSNLLLGWKRKLDVIRQLNKWIKYEDLTDPPISRAVQNWNLF